MSFLSNLADKQRKIQADSPVVRPAPITADEMTSGLAGTIRDPYRVNPPLNPRFTDAGREQVQVNQYLDRGY